jgi:hypothetical protein
MVKKTKWVVSFTERFSNFNLALKNLYLYKSDKKTVTLVYLVY